MPSPPNSRRASWKAPSNPETSCLRSARWRWTNFTTPTPCASALLAAERATLEDRTRINAAFAALEAAYDSNDMKACVDADVEFHQAIAEASHNAMIGHISASLMRVVQDHISANLVHLRDRPRQWQEIRNQHRNIWEAVCGGEAQASQQLAREHIVFVRKSMEEAAQAEDRRHSAQRRLS